MCAALVAGLDACHSPQQESVQLPVTVQPVSGFGTGTGLRYSAAIRPDVQVDVAFKVSGYIEAILQVRGADGRMRNVQDGDVVTRGTVLARVRDREYRDALAQAQATLTQAKADFDRVSQLFENRSVSKADYDAAYAKYTAGQAQHDQAELALSDCTLRAPMSGYVLHRSIEVGGLVSPGAAGFTIADTRSIKVVFGVPDVLVGSMRLGSTQAVAVEAVPGQLFRGHITRVAPSADATSRVFEVEVTIPNPEGRLKTGMIAALQVDAPPDAASAAKLVPLNAVVRPPGDPVGYAVFVAENREHGVVARLRRVQLGDVSGNMIQVTAGLQGGDRVIVRGATLVVDSQAVRVIP
jgi:multidrug efflux system membrane fusion protein